jgi:hypothetical protein
LLDGQTIKIPINGMPEYALSGLLSLIETKTGNANQALTNSFQKKTQQTPPAEIRLAEERKADSLRRRQNHG